MRLPNERPSSAVALGEKPGGVCAVAVTTRASTEIKLEIVCMIGKSVDVYTGRVGLAAKGD